MIKVLYGGAFDLLHYAHVLAIREAKSMGTYLIVNVVSDERVRAKKGPERPIIPAEHRVEMVRALRDVDEVVCLYGDPDYPVIKLLDMLNPDTLVLDKTEQDCELVERECAKRDIRIVYLDRIHTGLDTTGIIAKIRR